MFLSTGEGGPIIFVFVFVFFLFSPVLFCDLVEIEGYVLHIFPFIPFPGLPDVSWIRKSFCFVLLCFVPFFGRGGRGVCWLSFCIKSILRNSFKIIAGLLMAKCRTSGSSLLDHSKGLEYSE